MGLLWGQRNLVEGKGMQTISLRAICEFPGSFLGILKAQDPHLAERVAIISWSIWYKRNAVRTGSPSLPYSMIHAEAMERLQEFQGVQEMPTTLQYQPVGSLLLILGVKLISMGPSSKI